MLAREADLQSRPRMLSASATSLTVSHGNSRCTTGSSSTGTKMNAPMIGTTSLE